MDILFWTMLAAGFVLHRLNMREQGARIALLGRLLGRYRIEQLMQTLIQNYLRALAEEDVQRQAQIWQMLHEAERELCEQFNALALDFSQIAAPLARVSRLPVALPYAAQWWPRNTFDMRKLLSLHAHALAQAASASHVTPKRRAFTLMAEMLLMQHSCHWFCRSKLVASARLMARHQTRYEQVLEAVAAPTRLSYDTVVGGRSA